MFKHLLVPLDGSPLAETALPVAAYLAQTLLANVTLLHLVEQHPPAEVHHARHLTHAAEASAYLEDIKQRAFPTETPVECHVHTTEITDVALSIMEHASELSRDLIVMSTHGRGGPRRWLFGSIAQQVIAQGRTPVLLIPPAPAARTNFQCQRIVVPLDGNAEHEQGLRVAIGLARACHAAIHLVLVVPTLDRLTGEKAATGKLMPLATSVMLDMQQENAGEYLTDQLAQLQPSGLALSAEVARGEPAAAVVDAVKRVNADLIALGTHGKTGMDAFWSGSITPRISDQSPTPLLLVRV